MTKGEALEALDQGYKISHVLFKPGEWIKQCPNNPHNYVYEDGQEGPKEVFWHTRDNEAGQSGYSIVYEVRYEGSGRPEDLINDLAKLLVQLGGVAKDRERVLYEENYISFYSII